MLRDAVVMTLGHSWPGVVTAQVRIDAAPPGTQRCGVGESVWALAYTEVVGPLVPGARVRIDVTPLALGLGTGGQALVQAVWEAPPPDRLPALGGHIMKARYTPIQQAVLAAEEQHSPHHALLTEATDVAGMPVVACDLHSMVPAVLAGIYQRRPGARVALLYTDGAALPAAYSMTCQGLVEAGWLSDVVTCAQAWGGTLEAVSIPSGLAVARHVGRADIVVAAQGPGNAGTGTPWGFSGVDVAWVLTAAATLAGHPIAALRVSSADQRGRHRAISHHTRQAVGALTHVPVTLPVPRFTADTDLERGLAESVGDLTAAARELAGERHAVVEVPTTGLVEALERCPVRLSTMGRGLAEDPGVFLAAAAAGVAAAGALEAAGSQLGDEDRARP